MSVAPGNLMTMPTNTTVTVSWETPSDPNGVVSEYVIILMSEMMASVDQSVNTTTLEAMFDELAPFTNYTVTVRALTGEQGDIQGLNTTDTFMTTIGGIYNYNYVYTI